VNRPILIGIAVVTVLVAVAAGGAYAYFFSGLRSAPNQLTLGGATASPAASTASPAPAAPAAALAGSWTVSGGSQAGYRVREQFAGQTSTHEAVARTSAVSGSLTVADTGSGLRATAVKFTANLTSLKSVDQVAGFDVANRDRIVSRTLSVSQFPDAAFVADAVALPAAITGGGTTTLTIPGQLTIHGVTRAAQVQVQLQMKGGQVDVAGSTSFAMTDYGVAPPALPITTVNPQVTLEFQLVLAKG
jgi:polyisoprenoid-binding protein YceI